MARGYAKMTLVGNLGADPALRYTPDGTPVVDLRMAVNTRTRKNDEVVDTVDWFNVSAWGSLAENAAEYLSKGSRLMVSGRFTSRQYESKEGEQRTSLDVRADDLLYLDPPAEDREAEAPKAEARPQARARR